MDVKKQTLSSIEWSAGAQIAKQVLQFIISIILIRLLTPKDFGLIGMIMVFIGFAGLFSELGFGAALIQKKKIKERHLSSIFWLNIATGLILTGIMLAIAPVIATFYNEPRLKLLTIVLSATFFIGSIGIVQKAILKRSMNFRMLAIVETLAMVIAGIFAIAIAFLGFGVWSLVWQAIVSAIIGVIVLWFLSDWKPSLRFNKNAAKELLGFSGNLLAFNVFNYWARNVDDLLIGKVIGSSGLGIYNRAYSIMLMPLRQISFTVGQVMFPMLSKIQDDKVRVKHLYLSTISIIALITFPMMMGLLVVADSFVIVLFGQKWADLIPILQVFCLLGMTQSIGTTVGWIYQSQGRTDWMFWWGIAAGTVGVISFIIGISIGSIMAVAYCYAIAHILLFYHNLTIPGKLINMTFSDVVRSLSGVFGCAVLMAGGVYLLGVILPSEWPHRANLLFQVPFGIMIYIVLIHLFKLKSYVEAKELFWEQWENHFNKK
jgi:PST family polysaccharide transporter